LVFYVYWISQVKEQRKIRVLEATAWAGIKGKKDNFLDF